MLVELKMREQDIVGALELWEWYRAALLRVKSQGSANIPTVPKLSFAVLDAGPELPVLDEIARHQSALTTQTIVSYAVLPNGLAIWVYDNRGVHGKWTSSNSHELTQHLRKFTELCADPKSNISQLRQEGRYLYTVLFAGIADWLAPDRQLLIEPDDDMQGSPFEALIDPNGTFLTAHYTLNWSPGLYYADSLRPQSVFSRSDRVLVVGPPPGADEEGRPLPALPDAIDEAQTVARQFRLSALLLHEHATLANIRSAMPASRIFHFAGHALTRSTHMGLVVASGTDAAAESPQLLDARNLSTMDLRQMELAVLSACATENGTDDSPLDPDSLVRIFFRFGVPHVVASRWNVDSRTTAAMMNSFYAAFSPGQGSQKSTFGPLGSS